MPPLGSDDRRTLLEIARRAVTLAIQKRERLRVDIPPGILSEPAGAFVTLQRHKRLRGCIGRLAPSEPLAQVVADSAMSAALEDPRFEPLRPEELADVEIEISVLSKFAPIAREEVQPGTHGLVIQRGNLRGLLLPQVASEYNWSRERFLEETCVKAGLPRDAWRDGATQISGFTAEVFSEEDFRK
ncbi:MAG: AmmeMemoRadiSam system protein A [Candidatus Acidiferrales bacterium]